MSGSVSSHPSLWHVEVDGYEEKPLVLDKHYHARMAGRNIAWLGLCETDF